MNSRQNPLGLAMKPDIIFYHQIHVAEERAENREDAKEKECEGQGGQGRLHNTAIIRVVTQHPRTMRLNIDLTLHP